MIQRIKCNIIATTWKILSKDGVNVMREIKQGHITNLEMKKYITNYDELYAYYNDIFMESFYIRKTTLDSIDTIISGIAKFYNFDINQDSYILINYNNPNFAIYYDNGNFYESKKFSSISDPHMLYFLSQSQGNYNKHTKKYFLYDFDFTHSLSENNAIRILSF